MRGFFLALCLACTPLATQAQPSTNEQPYRFALCLEEDDARAVADILVTHINNVQEAVRTAFPYFERSACIITRDELIVSEGSITLIGMWMLSSSEAIVLYRRTITTSNGAHTIYEVNGISMNPI